MLESGRVSTKVKLSKDVCTELLGLKDGELSGKKREEAERLGIATQMEGGEDLLADLEGLRAKFEMVGSYPDLVAQAQLYDGKTEVDPVGQLLEQQRAQREREQELKELDAEAYLRAKQAEAVPEFGFSVSEEMADIKAAAEKEGTFMKAPNGKATNLTERQWLQVRTKAFKEWFGDWEKVARFRAVRDAIMNMPVVAMLTGQEFQSDGVKLTDKVPAYWDGTYQGSVESPELGRVVLDKEGVQSSIGHGVGRLKAAAFYAVPDVIQKGRVFDRQKDWKGRGYDTAVIAAPISIGEKEYICEVVVEQRSNRQGFYVHEVEIKEKLGNVFKTATKGSTRQASRSILALRDAEVNTIWKNCSKVVDENGEPRVVYHGARYAGFRVFDNEEGDRKSDAPDGSNFFSSSRAVAYSYAGSYDEPDLLDEELQQEIDDYGIKQMDAGIYEVFLNIRDPHYFDFKGRNWQPDEDFYSLVDENGDYIYPLNGDELYSTREEAEARAEELGLEGYEIYTQYRDTNMVTQEAMDMGSMA